MGSQRRKKKTAFCSFRPFGVVILRNSRQLSRTPSLCFSSPFGSLLAFSAFTEGERKFSEAGPCDEHGKRGTGNGRRREEGRRGRESTRRCCLSLFSAQKFWEIELREWWRGSFKGLILANEERGSVILRGGSEDRFGWTKEKKEMGRVVLLSPVFSQSSREQVGSRMKVIQWRALYRKRTKKTKEDERLKSEKERASQRGRKEERKVVRESRHRVVREG